MTLQAQPRSCFSTVRLLRYRGRPIGEYTGRIFGESIDIHATSQQRYRFAKQGLMTSRFHLIDAATGQPHAAAQRAGLFTRTWDLALTHGRAEFAPAGLFATGYRLVEGGAVLAEANRLGACAPGWMVHDHTAGMPFTDLLLIGLVYHTILARRRRSSGAGAGGAGGS